MNFSDLIKELQDIADFTCDPHAKEAIEALIERLNDENGLRDRGELE